MTFHGHFYSSIPHIMRNHLAKLVLILLWSCAPGQQVSDITPLESTPDSLSISESEEPLVESLEPPEFLQRGPYRAEETKLHDLIHTKLEVSFDWENQFLLGKATLELRPYFYPRKELILDAKGFEMHSVKMLQGGSAKKLDYQYDQLELRIALDREYSADESYLVEIEYTARPNQKEAGGSQAITSDKGLYFINPLNQETGKPQQIWTQGETEASSCWFPTIDNPNQRTTQEIYITVQERFKTLSNGDLIYARSNGDGTRTDYWKLEQSHAPYLFMMAVGEFSVVKDKWKDIELSYYVEPEYEQYASAIFGNTSEMMGYFSELLDYPYPWSKYAQVVVRDYVSGAMENTTASVFMEDLQVDDRYLLDQDWDFIIAHELFHQWFGDLVTCESWSNLTLNEAFANYAEYLWTEHKLGKDEADLQGYKELTSYLAEAEQKQVDLIRFYYDDKEDMFDNHSYAKGGRVLHMLRMVVGDDAFFKALNVYLTKNAYQPVEVHHLRLAFEETTGRDLNWFFNQWFLDSGHPVLNVSTHYQNDSLYLRVLQQQDLGSTPLYRLPVTLQIGAENSFTEHQIEITEIEQVFTFYHTTEPEYVVFDSENHLLGEVNFNRSKSQLISQFRSGSSGITRWKALQGLLADSVADQQMVQVLTEALDDDFWPVRQIGVNVFQGYQGDQFGAISSKLKSLAESDPNNEVRADAITTLSSFDNSNEYGDLYKTAVDSRSYQVSGAGLTAYLQTDASDKEELLAKYEQEENINLVLPLADFYALEEIDGKYQWYSDRLSTSQGELLYYLTNYFGQYLTNAPTELQIEGSKELEQLALNHHAYYIRFSAYQALSLLEEVPGVPEIKQRVKNAEKDPRLIQVYQQMP